MSAHPTSPFSNRKSWKIPSSQLFQIIFFTFCLFGLTISCILQIQTRRVHQVRYSPTLPNLNPSIKYDSSSTPQYSSLLLIIAESPLQNFEQILPKNGISYEVTLPNHQLSSQQLLFEILYGRDSSESAFFNETQLQTWFSSQGIHGSGDIYTTNILPFPIDFLPESSQIFYASSHSNVVNSFVSNSQKSMIYFTSKTNSSIGIVSLKELKNFSGSKCVAIFHKTDSYSARLSIYAPNIMFSSLIPNLQLIQVATTIGSFLENATYPIHSVSYPKPHPGINSFKVGWQTAFESLSLLDHTIVIPEQVEISYRVKLLSYAIRKRWNHITNNLYTKVPRFIAPILSIFTIFFYIFGVFLNRKTDHRYESPDSNLQAEYSNEHVYNGWNLVKSYISNAFIHFRFHFFTSCHVSHGLLLFLMPFSKWLSILVPVFYASTLSLSFSPLESRWPLIVEKTSTFCVLSWFIVFNTDSTSTFQSLLAPFLPPLTLLFIAIQSKSLFYSNFNYNVFAVHKTPDTPSLYLPFVRTQNSNGEVNNVSKTLSTAESSNSSVVSQFHSSIAQSNKFRLNTYIKFFGLAMCFFIAYTLTVFVPRYWILYPFAIHIFLVFDLFIVVFLILFSLFRPGFNGLLSLYGYFPVPGEWGNLKVSNNSLSYFWKPLLAFVSNQSLVPLSGIASDPSMSWKRFCFQLSILKGSQSDQTKTSLVFDSFQTWRRCAHSIISFEMFHAFLPVSFVCYVATYDSTRSLFIFWLLLIVLWNYCRKLIFNDPRNIVFVLSICQFFISQIPDPPLILLWAMVSIFLWYSATTHHTLVDRMGHFYQGPFRFTKPHWYLLYIIFWLALFSSFFVVFLAWIGAVNHPYVTLGSLTRLKEFSCGLLVFSATWNVLDILVLSQVFIWEHIVTCNPKIQRKSSFVQILIRFFAQIQNLLKLNAQMESQVQQRLFQPQD